MQKQKEYLRLKERYPFACFYCKENQYAAPSLFMETFQLNLGGAWCPGCKHRIHLRINEDNESMSSYEDLEEANAKHPKLPDSCFVPQEALQNA